MVCGARILGSNGMECDLIEVSGQMALPPSLLVLARLSRISRSRLTSPRPFLICVIVNPDRLWRSNAARRWSAGEPGRLYHGE
jgi:hypothetical protein